MRRTSGSVGRWTAAGAAVVLAAGLSPAAQTQSPSGGAPSTAQAAAQPAQAGAPDARGGRGGRRGGPETLAGGPQLDDPAYAEVDFSKKEAVPALTPQQELTKFILQPGYHLELVLADPDIQEP